MENIVGPSNAHVNDKSNDSNDDGTIIDISSSHMFGLEDIEQPLPSDDFIMFIVDEESSGS